jgi:hypothetical protein
MGCFQTAGVDYNDTFAPVMVSKSFRTALQLWNLSPEHEMEQWDVKAAFCMADLEEEVYCDQPIGHEDPNFPMGIWLLKKSLYGLKQSANNWSDLLRTVFEKAGATVMNTDPGIMHVKDKDAWVVICIHVDDIFPVYNEAGRRLRNKLAKA